MRYTSTRDSSLSFSFEEAICRGYAPDGGLFVPCHLPRIDYVTLSSWRKFTYLQLAIAITRMFIDPQEISNDDLYAICKKSFSDGFDYSSSKDNNKDDGNDDDTTRTPVPVIRLVGGTGFITELFHGPTFCFKDLGMRGVVNMLSHFATKRQRKVTLLVSTTGDTGPAAVQAVSDASNPLLTLLVHYPIGQISAFQRKQLTTANSPYVKVATFEGGGDDMDLPIKRILSLSSSLSSSKDDTNTSTDDGGLDEDQRLLCGVNSYNIGRPLMQMIHFIWTYLRVVEQLGIEAGDTDSPVDIIVPTGAMGNIAGAYMAKKMGVPIGTLCAGVNINDISHRVIQSGKFHKSARMEKTLSEAINIQVPYNFERLLFYLTDGQHTLVKEWMEAMKTTEKLDLDHFWHEKLKSEFHSARITDDEICTMMRKIRNKFNYFIDPHTAVAVCASEKLGYNVSSSSGQNNNYDEKARHLFSIISTASPCKFEEAITTAMDKNGWQEFCASPSFPESAMTILQKDEVEPILYPWIDKSASLNDVQKLWESQALNLIRNGF